MHNSLHPDNQVPLADPYIRRKRKCVMIRATSQELVLLRTCSQGSWWWTMGLVYAPERNSNV